MADDDNNAAYGNLTKAQLRMLHNIGTKGAAYWCSVRCNYRVPGEARGLDSGGRTWRALYPYLEMVRLRPGEKCPRTGIENTRLILLTRFVLNDEGLILIGAAEE